MMRKSLIVVTILSAFAYSGIASATVSAGNASVTPGATGQTSAITWATRAGVTGAGFDVNVVDASNITTGDTFQVTLGNGTFVACDGSERVQADFNTGITCSATGVYSIRTLDNTAIPNLNNNMRLLFDVAAGATNGQTATVQFGPYCTGVQTPASDGCVAFFLADASRQANPTAPTSVNGTITVAVAATPLTLSYNPVPGPIPAFPAGNAGATSAPQNIVVTATGTSGTASLTGCVASAGFGVSSPTLNFAAAGSQNLGVTCTYTAAAQTGTVTCSETDADSAAVQRQWTTSCPAGALVPANPAITHTPASGSTTNLPGGSVGAVSTGVIDFSAAGGAGSGSATIACTTAAPLSITNANQTVTGSAAPLDVTVSCTLTAVQQNGSVSCAITDVGGARNSTFLYVCPAGSTVVAPTQPDIIPATSLWSKLGLIGLLAALGMLMVGFRRQQ